MSFLTNLLNLFSKNKEQARLKTSIELLSAYGEVLGQYAGHGKAPISKLPASKESITAAANYLIKASRQPNFGENLSRFLTKAQVDHVTSPDFLNNVAAGLVFLETFVPDNQAR